MATATYSTAEKPNVRKELFHLPPVGWNIRWHAQGSLTEDPQAAIVTQVEPHGLLNMHVFPGRGQPKWYGPVRHVSDPFHASHPEAAARLGGWDWIPGHQPSQEYLASVWEEIVRRYHACGHTNEAIAARVERTTVDKVAAFLKREGMAPRKSKTEGPPFDTDK